LQEYPPEKRISLPIMASDRSDKSAGMQEELLESRVLYRGRVVVLRLDTVRMPNGHITQREIVEHRGAVAIVPLLNADTVLLIRQYRQAVGETLLEIPAGTLEPDEPPDQCAARELQEETGYRAAHLRHLFSQYLAPGYSQEVLHVYLAEELTPAQAHTEADEMVELAPTPLSQIVPMILNGAIKDAKTIAGLLMTLRLLGR
jgi:ADP-ribose pyrophosphatase